MSVKHKRPVVLFTFVQTMGAYALIIVGSALAVYCFGIVRDLVTAGLGTEPGALWQLFQLICRAGVGVCLFWLLLEFVLLCGRVRKETAFTAANARALGRIALAFVIGGVLLLPPGQLLMDLLLMGMRGITSSLWWPLPAFVAWTAALLVRALQVLLRRAVEMQTESDLTV
jgi:hypothetical protein